MAYLLFNRFLIIINQIWQEGERLQKEEKISPEISLLIKKIEEVKKKTKPTKILNLQKVITPKSKEKKIIPAINIQKSEEPRVVKIQVPKIETKDLTPPSTMPEISGTKIDIPKIKSENLTPTSWFPKEEKDKKEKEEKEQSTKVVIIKKDQRGQKDEGVVDLSQY
ncbi:MAG: hypothetical protein NZ866_00790, partial [Patescibacteria group bacterium]|nr:hypothetical protein [Patescibacteria group bacterium]